jgi:acetyl esterase/lipase
MARPTRGLLAPFMLVLWAPDGSAQDYSSSITSAYRVAPNVTYLKTGAWEGKVDIYYRTDSSGPHPTLIWIHGGAVDAGSKEGATLNLLPYLEWGWNVVNLEHRLPGVTLAPTALQNSLCALRWIIRNSEEYGFDTDKLVISGTSSGGWFAVAAAMAARPAGWEQLCPGTEEPAVAAVVNWFGNWDLADILQGPNEKPYAAGWVQGLPNPLEVANSLLPRISPELPPIISIHGDADPIVPYTQSARLHEALKRVGAVEEMITIPGGKHGRFTRSENQRAFVAIEAFLVKQGIPAGRLASERLPPPSSR